MKRLILLVEDHTDLLEVTQKALEFRGYEVAAAKNGLEAVEMATARLPDLILMDVLMPVMDGIEATFRIRADSRTKDIPIITTTASARAEDRERCLAAGCDDFVSKPYTYIELTAVIERILKVRESKVA